MSFLDMLMGVTGATPPPPQTNTTSQPDPAAVSGLVVRPPANTGASQNPLGPSDNYNNSGDVNAIHQSLASSPPQGGSDNPGLYGLLPQNLQHGTLRNVLGALGDAFLVGHGDAPTYAPRMQRQAIGNAAAGFDQDPEGAIARVAATGAPGAAEMAMQMRNALNEQKLRQATMENTQQWRQSMQGDRENTIINRQIPLVGGMFQGINDKDAYAKAYQRATTMAQRVNPSLDATQAYGIPAPEDWTPDQTAHAGMTGNNVTQSNDRAAARQQSGENAQTAAGSRVQAAGISRSKPTEGTILESLIQKQNSGQPLTSSEQAVWARYTNIKKSGGGLSAGLTPGGGGGGTQQYSPVQAAKLPSGTKFQGLDGNWYVKH